MNIAYPLIKPVKKEELYKKAVKWFNESFPGSKEKITVDKSAGKVSEKEFLKLLRMNQRGIITG